jgi:hypothetical protein
MHPKKLQGSVTSECVCNDAADVPGLRKAGERGYCDGPWLGAASTHGGLTQAACECDSGAGQRAAGNGQRATDNM